MVSVFRVTASKVFRRGTEKDRCCLRMRVSIEMGGFLLSGMDLQYWILDFRNFKVPAPSPPHHLNKKEKTSRKPDAEAKLVP